MNKQLNARIDELEKKTSELELQLQNERQKLDKIYEMTYSTMREFADEFHLKVPRLDELGSKR